MKNQSILPCGLVLPVPVTSPPSPKSLKATTLTVYSVLAVRPLHVVVVVVLFECINVPSLYTLYLNDSPPVLDDAVQVTISWSHDPDGGDGMRLVGAPGTIHVYICMMTLCYIEEVLINHDFK